MSDDGKAAKKLGPAPANASDQAPQNVLAEALTYVSHNRDRMDYARYRRQGLPVGVPSPVSRVPTCVIGQGYPRSSATRHAFVRN